MDDLISTTRGARKRVKARNAGGFSVKARTRFLDALAVTCNISKAAAFAGVHPTTVYKTRAKDAIFAEQWVAAMAIGYDRLEALVLEHGGAGADIEVDPERAVAAGLRADTAGFARDVAQMKGAIDGPLQAGADRAGRAIETSLARAVRTGKLGFDDLRKAALSMLGEIAGSAVRGGIASVLGGSLSGVLGKIVGAPARATGGPVSPDRPYWVGERGPELFVPTASGRV